MTDKNIKEARKYKKPCIYLIKDSTGLVVYVGQTKNPNKRFETYQYKKTHNYKLSKWLKANKPFFEIIPCSINKLDELEIKYISKFENLFNLTAGGSDTHFTEANAWGVKGALCPSRLILLSLRNRNSVDIEPIKNLIKKMSNKNRCAFEVSLAMEYINNFRFTEKINKWLDLATPQLLGVLNG